MAGSSASEVLFISVNHSITLMGESPLKLLFMALDIGVKLKIMRGNLSFFRLIV